MCSRKAVGTCSDDSVITDALGHRCGRRRQHTLEEKRAADLVITVGYDPIEYPPSLWNGGNSRKLIHVDVLPADLDNAYRPAVELEGNIAASLKLLAPQLKRVHPSGLSEDILRRIRIYKDALADRAAGLNGTPIHPMRLVHELPNGQQTLGVALPWAIAASIVRPSEKVLSISGDGGFLFSAMELETAVRLKANIIHMVWIGGTYDMVRTQEVQKHGRPSGTDFGPLDVVKYAEAFGAKGMMIRSPDEFTPVLKQALDYRSGPVLIGVQVDYSDNHKLFESVHADSFQ
jgi:acetolactate synthase I/II/III large subunit